MIKKTLLLRRPWTQQEREIIKQRKKSLSNQTKESFKGIFESIPSRNLIQFKSYHSQAFNQKQEQSQIYHLTDFRIAKIWKPQNRHETSGTQGYMAPEVICRQNLMEFLQISLLQELFCMNLGKRPYNPSWKCILCSQYLVCMLIDSNCQQVITLPAQGTIRSFIFTFSLLFCLLNCFTFFAQIDNLALRFYRAGILGLSLLIYFLNDKWLEEQLILIVPLRIDRDNLRHSLSLNITQYILYYKQFRYLLMNILHLCIKQNKQYN
ncbi:unnamed protein product [Paramecium sonneborni]|uniref:Uncharacterized protein n=1 Tax=Paramecium sonneborni TaxID=65129 RepID=A0A8S1RMQ8_9CILI|nr:unnamed protein product [Paramecium sonneborni]